MENIRKRCNVYLETDPNHLLRQRQNQLMSAIKFFMKI